MSIEQHRRIKDAEAAIRALQERVAALEAAQDKRPTLRLPKKDA
jgi:hypothetical protein